MNTGVCCTVVLGSVLLAGFSSNEGTAPDALKLFLEFRTVLQTAEGVLRDPAPGGMALPLSGAVRPGVLLTDLYDYASGTLAKNHLGKIAVRPDLSDGTWEKVRYKLQVTVEPLEKRETRVAVDAVIEALKRSFTGKEEWVTLVSNGNLEETFLVRLGRRLFGPQFSLEGKKKGFWERDPRYVPGSEGRIPTLPTPDTKPPF
ncbi:MAG: hypothetical protein HY315_03340 [Acidobacteria bacterium]|nr:hypothetical protein [Acidobacteriota bacterium]